MYRSAAVFIISLFVFSACDSAELMDQESTSQLRQFEVGDVWVMSRVDSLEFSGATDRIDSLKVTESRSIDGEEWFYISSQVESPFGGVGGGSPWLTVRPDGIWIRGIEGSVVGAPRPYLPYPSEVGSVYTRSSGLEVVRIAEQQEVVVAGETILAIPFELRSTRIYRPFSDVPESLEAYREYPVDKNFSFVDMIAPDLGFVHLEGVYVSPRPDEQIALVIGGFRLELIQFIPGG
jgi:hypothetical protein